MIALLLAAILAAPVCLAPRDAHGFVRSQAVRAAFMRANPCPGGPDAGSTKRCRGWEAHHVVPLACGGEDTVDRLVWLTVDQHRRLHAATVCRAACVMPGGAR